MASDIANNPPPGECPQCWYHAYASHIAHAGLRWNEDCPACLAHLELHRQEKRIRWW